MPPPNFKSIKPKNTKQTLKRVLGYIKNGYKFSFALVVICIIFTSLVSVASSLLIKTVIDDHISPMLAGQGSSFAALFGTLCAMAGLFLMGVVANYIFNLLMVKISQGILRDVRNQMFKKMQNLPISFFDQNKHGDIMSKFTNDTDALETMLAQSIPQAISSILTVVFVFCSMLFLSVYLTVIVILFLVVISLVVKTVGAKSAKFFAAQQKSVGKTTAFVEEMIAGQKVIKIFNHEQQTKKDFEAINNELCFNATNANKYANVFMPIMGNLGHLQYVVIAIVGGILAVSGAANLSIMGFSIMGLGTIASFLQLSRSFNHPLSQISQQMNAIIVALASAERIFKLLDTKDENDDGKIKLVNVAKTGSTLTKTNASTNIFAWEDENGNLTELKGDVRFFDVSFGYKPNQIVLKNISLYAKPGHKIAFVGATGAGKTTITNLINRFYDINCGKITYDGIEIEKISKPDLRRSIGMVLQDTNLFTGTVKDNIKYGNLDATDEEIENAAKLANAHDFITRLPQGYNTMLTQNASNLSQGQRQLLSSARAIVANPPVMILDEATSSIDTHTEYLIQKGMDALMKGRTVFVIAHRLSTVQNANVIMVLENGEIVERGTHDFLIEQKGKYYELYTGKLELE